MNGGPNDSSSQAIMQVGTYVANGSKSCVSSYAFSGTPPDIAGEQCAAKPSFFSSFNGDASDGLCDSGCGFVADTSAGITITRNATGQGAVAATFKPTGATCDGSGGGATNPVPPVNSPAVFTPNLPDPPKLCGGGSCYNPRTGDACAVVDGHQLCRKFPTTAQPSGGCVSGEGGATLCVGAPPPMPGNPPIADPALSLRSSDTYQKQENAPTGAVLPVVANIFTPSPASPVDSGQQAGDSGPAPASSTGGPEVTSSGGGDCNTPPIITGSPALAQVAFQAWKTRCAIEGTQGGVVGGLGDLYTPSTDTVGSVVGEFKAGVAASPVASSVTGFFSVGSVGGSCPVWTVPENDYLPAMTFDFYCRPELADLLDMAQFVLLIGCAYAAWRIAMGDA